MGRARKKFQELLRGKTNQADALERAYELGREAAREDATTLVTSIPRRCSCAVGPNPGCHVHGDNA